MTHPLKRLVSLTYMDGTAENIGVEDFTIDGNKFRQNKSLQPAGGSRSSNIRFAGVKRWLYASH